MASYPRAIFDRGRRVLTSKAFEFSVKTNLQKFPPATAPPPHPLKKKPDHTPQENSKIVIEFFQKSDQKFFNTKRLLQIF
jgi:hypothetical protein